MISLSVNQAVGLNFIFRQIASTEYQVVFDFRSLEGKERDRVGSKLLKSL